MSYQKPTRKRFYARPRWRNPGKAYEPRTRAQERRQKMPSAFTTRAQWRYGDARTEAREQRIKQQARRVLGVGEFFQRIVRRLFPGYKARRIDSNIYHVES